MSSSPQPLSTSTPRRRDGAARRGHGARWPRFRRASVLVVVLVTLLFAAMALVTFLDKATNDLLVEHREIRAKRLRREAYSALETTLAVLEDFRRASNGLHSAAEGWSDPLGFAGYTPGEGLEVQVTFEDESGKLSLPRADVQVLSRLFQSWGVIQAEADELADLMMGWMKRDHVYATATEPKYDMSAIPYDSPGRPMRSYAELAAIDKVREFFYDPSGLPNDNWRRFVASVSLFNFEKPNINSANASTLAALGQYDEYQQRALGEYVSGTGTYDGKGPAYFRDLNEAQSLAGGQGGNSKAFTTTISALRIIITVREGRSEFRTAAVVTWGNAARAVQENATTNRRETSTSAAKTASQRQAAPDAQKQKAGRSASTRGKAATDQNLRYPFTLLEIQENDEIPPAPPPPAPETPL